MKNTVLAFFIGSNLRDWAADYERLGAAGLDKEDAATATSCSLVFLSALFTG